MSGTYYTSCHIQMISFPCYGHCIPNLSVIRDQMQINSLAIFLFPCLLYTPISSTTRQCTWCGSKIKPCSFNLSFHQETKDMEQNDWNNRESSKKGGHSSSEALNHHTHAKSFMLWCVPVSGTWYTVQPLGIYHVPCTLLGCWSNCMIGIFTCCLSRAYTPM